MSASAPALVRSWQVGKRTCVLTVSRPEAGQQPTSCIEWFPSQPRRMSGGELRAYRRGRNAAFAEIAAELGIVMLLIET